MRGRTVRALFAAGRPADRQQCAYHQVCSISSDNGQQNTIFVAAAGLARWPLSNEDEQSDHRPEAQHGHNCARDNPFCSVHDAPPPSAVFSPSPLPSQVAYQRMRHSATGMRAGLVRGERHTSLTSSAHWRPMSTRLRVGLPPSPVANSWQPPGFYADFGCQASCSELGSQRQGKRSD